MLTAAVISTDAFRGGQRVTVQASHLSDLQGKTLIVVAPEQPYLRVTPHAVQCFDPETGYIWPVPFAQVAKV